MSKVIEFTPELIERLKARKEMKSLLESTEWTPIQLLFQEVQVACEIREVIEDVKISVKEQIEMLKEKINKEFEDDEELKQAFLDAIPCKSSIYYLIKGEAWQKAVQSKIRSSYVFSNKNQLRVMEALLKAATAASGGGGSVRAQELYFKLEGSLGKEQGSQEKDATYERYKNLQKTLHKK